MTDRFGSRAELVVGSDRYTIHRLDAVKGAENLPYSLKILLEGLLRNDDGSDDAAEDLDALATWRPKSDTSREISFTPARVLLQDFTGVPAVVDLAAMRDAMRRLGGDPTHINPLQPVDLVIDHSVQVDAFGNAGAFAQNVEFEYRRNEERYRFLRWGQQAFRNFRVVPPGTGIVHQVNLEHLASVVFTGENNVAYPDTLVGTDSHTTMINGLGVLGWGVGGIEAEAAMLGQPVSMLIPQVVGFKLTGQLPERCTATDLVLTVTQILRRKGVVGKFVEFHGDGIASLSLADRATIGNMSPEYGATCAIFPVDHVTLQYLRLTGRPEKLVRLVEAYTKEQGLYRELGAPDVHYTANVELDLSTVEPSVAGPSRPQDRVRLADVGGSFRNALQLRLAHAEPKAAEKEITRLKGEGGSGTAVGALDAIEQAPASQRGDCAEKPPLQHGAVVIAAITSCTNTSNPAVLIAAGLLAKNAVALGLKSKPWVKTSLAPGSKVVTDYLKRAELMEPLETLGFNLVGYGCTTCIGNSGPLPEDVSKDIEQHDLMVAAVLSGNRNFEGRIHPAVRANYLASPPLVVAYALAGRIDIDLSAEPLGEDREGKPVHLHDIWPSHASIEHAMGCSVSPEAFADVYRDVFKGEERWASLEVAKSDAFAWDEKSTYVKHPPYFENMTRELPKSRPITNARVLAVLGDSITTDHISPAGSMKANSPAGMYLNGHGVTPHDFNSYGSRRGNHEVMVRGTFANVRLKNYLAPGTEGGVTRHFPSGELMSIYDAAMRYRDEGVPLIVIAGSDYGSGSSRDWAAKGPMLLGVRAVIAESYERIHRSNLVGMGILPLQFGAGDDADRLGLSGEETFELEGIDEAVINAPSGAGCVSVCARRKDGVCLNFDARVRIDTPQEVLYYQHGGILQYVLRQLLARG